MRAYQDEDPLHGHGKAMPHPKAPTRYSYRGGAFGSPVQLDGYQKAKRENYEVAQASGRGLMTAVALIAACLGFRCGRQPPDP